MSNQATFVIIGHCGADSYSLSSLVDRAVPQANVVAVNDAASLAAHDHPGAVWLVNRVLDGAFRSSGGIDLIRHHHRPVGPAMILISNYADAQQQAVEAGATPGFGKNEIGSPRVVELLRSLGAPHEATPSAHKSNGD